MSKLSQTSKANVIKHLGRDIKQFMEVCDNFSMKLSDAADGEKSLPLRVCLRKTSEDVYNLSQEVGDIIGSEA